LYQIQTCSYFYALKRGRNSYMFSAKQCDIRELVGLAPFSQTVGSLLRTRWPTKPPRNNDEHRNH